MGIDQHQCAIVSRWLALTMVLANPQLVATKVAAQPRRRPLTYLLTRLRGLGLA